MAQDSGSDRQNKTIDFLQNNPIYVIVGLLAVLTIVYFIATGGSNDSNEVATNETQEQTGQNQPAGNQPNTNENGQTPAEAPTDSQNEDGVDVTSTGILRESDNAARGNLMVENASGNIYVSTSRDFASLIGSKVTLNAAGSLDNFVFLGFNDSKVAGTDTTAMGGENEANDEVGNVSFSGKLRSSDNIAKGNYVVYSGNTHVYLQTVRDYSAWVGQDVVLNATGSLNSFTNATLVLK